MRTRAWYAAVAASATLALAAAPRTAAQVPIISTGMSGSVSLLDFAGRPESAPTNQTDIGQASVECSPGTRGRRAVFAGALAWAADARPGLGNDWQYVRVVAGAVDDEGRALTGEVSPYYPAYDDRPASLPPVEVALPHSFGSYTPVLMVQFFDATYDLLGTKLVASQTAAWRVRIATPPYGDYWYVAHDDLVQCS